MQSLKSCPLFVSSDKKFSAVKPQNFFSRSKTFRSWACPCSGAQLSSPESEQFTLVMKKATLNMVWLDMEMTGLDIDKDVILELACIVTDSNLNIKGQGVELVIHQPDSVLASMNPWCIEHHGRSGLTDKVRASTTSMEEAEEQVLRYIRPLTRVGRCPLAGNTIHMDKRFVDKFMPRLRQHLHYRLVDVSTIKELARRWYPSALLAAPKKTGGHRALADILDSIAELKYYQERVFAPRQLLAEDEGEGDSEEEQPEGQAVKEGCADS